MLPTFLLVFLNPGHIVDGEKNGDDKLLGSKENRKASDTVGQQYTTIPILKLRMTFNLKYRFCKMTKISTKKHMSDFLRVTELGFDSLQPQRELLAGWMSSLSPLFPLSSGDLVFRTLFW